MGNITILHLNREKMFVAAQKWEKKTLNVFSNTMMQCPAVQHDTKQAPTFPPSTWEPERNEAE